MSIDDQVFWDKDVVLENLSALNLVHTIVNMQ